MPRQVQMTYEAPADHLLNRYSFEEEGGGDVFISERADDDDEFDQL